MQMFLWRKHNRNNNRNPILFLWLLRAEDTVCVIFPGWVLTISSRRRIALFELVQWHSHYTQYLTLIQNGTVSVDNYMLTSMRGILGFYSKLLKIKSSISPVQFILMACCAAKLSQAGEKHEGSDDWNNERHRQVWAVKVGGWDLYVIRIDKKLLRISSHGQVLPFWESKSVLACDLLVFSPRPTCKIGLNTSRQITSPQINQWKMPLCNWPTKKIKTFSMVKISYKQMIVVTGASERAFQVVDSLKGQRNSWY